MTETSADRDAGSEDGGTIAEIRTGLRFVWTQGTLRTLALAAATFEGFRGLVGAVIIVFVVRELDLPPALIGVIFGVGGASALVGAVVAEPVMRRLGVGRALIIAFAISGLAVLFLPFATGPVALVVALLVVSQLAGDGFATIHEIGRVSVIQGLTPDRLQGRVNGAIRSLEWGAALLGLVLGGVLAEVIGLRATLALAGLGSAIAPVILARSSVARLSVLPGADAGPVGAHPLSPPLIE